MDFSISRKLAAEFVGTALLLAIVVGSGIMGDSLSGDDGLALLGNTIATGAGLMILIMIFGPISGAHFNPAVTLSFFLRREISVVLAFSYIVIQLLGSIAGVALAHAMFDLEIVQTSLNDRNSIGETVGEGVATFGLVLTILACIRSRPEAVPYAVGLFITAGYWFTSSTSFANPAVTIARMFTNTFAGIEPSSVPAFIDSQLLAAAIATIFAGWLFSEKSQKPAAVTN